jgi:hypothetical protein
LKGFEKIALAPGESKTVAFVLDHVPLPTGMPRRALEGRSGAYI